MKVLVTGAAGFIGMDVSQRLLARGDTVVGVDNLNDYYDPALKRARLDLLATHGDFAFQHIDVSDRPAMERLFIGSGLTRVVHLAAQAGVRYSVTNPAAYIDSNLVGFGNILEGCRHGDVEHLVYASSSSVYGGNETMPFSERQNVDHPLQPLCGNQESQRTHGAQLQSSFWPAHNRPSVLHRLWPMGPAGHGLVPLCEGHPGRQADSGLQQWRDSPGLHIHRRRVAGRRACPG